MEQRSKRNDTKKSHKNVGGKQQQTTATLATKIKGQPDDKTIQKTTVTKVILAGESSTELPKDNSNNTPFNSNTNEVLTISAEPDRKFAKRELVNNWDKYKDEIQEDDNEQLTAADFEKLLVAPSSVGGHFVFNSEKNWESASSNFETSQYFSLNLMELTKSLGSIPFYKRQGYSSDLFSEKEIAEMNRQAKLSENMLQSGAATVNDDGVSNINKNMLKLLSEKVDSPILASKEHFPEQKDTALPPAAEVKTQESDDELDALLGFDIKSTTLNLSKFNITVDNDQSLSDLAVNNVTFQSTADSSPPAPVVQSAAQSKDIQQWLDDILDD